MFILHTFSELFWDVVHDTHLSLHTFDDQVLINNALQDCNIDWKSPTIKGTAIHGVCRNFDLKVAILSETAVCRRCTNREGFAVWHKNGARGQEEKKRLAKEYGLWFLKRDWKTLNHSELKGHEWLQLISAT